jgi:tetratricopeptide (TPR) repeat protein
MQKQIFTLILIAATLFGAQSCSNMSGKNAETSIESAIPKLLDNPLTTGTDVEWEALLTNYDNAVLTLQKNPDALDQYILLAHVFITEARLTGNGNYYHQAAIKMLDVILASDKKDSNLEFQALTFKSGVLLSMHQFQAALDAGNAAYKISNHNAQLLGALVDANVELGHYAEAVKYCDMMIQLRPDIRSYSRVSYLRQIHGDNQGAIEAMKMAVESGLPGAESTEWARIVLGDLLLMTGDLKNAEICYSTADGLRNNYAYAKAGMGRLEKAKKNYAAAIQHTEAAITIMTDVAFINQLADIYALQGDKDKAEEIRKDVLDILKKAEKEEDKMEVAVKHNAARELAEAYLHTGNFDDALKFAKQDAAYRPANIDANELVAWTAYLNKDYATAKKYADNMLITKTKNPATLYKASIIYKKAGNTSDADKLMQDAVAMNPAIELHMNTTFSE